MGGLIEGVGLFFAGRFPPVSSLHGHQDLQRTPTGAHNGHHRRRQSGHHLLGSLQLFCIHQLADAEQHHAVEAHHLQVATLVNTPLGGRIDAGQLFQFGEDSPFAAHKRYLTPQLTDELQFRVGRHTLGKPL